MITSHYRTNARLELVIWSVFRGFHRITHTRVEGKITSYKGLIIEWCQKNKKKYFIDTYEDTGNETVKHFSVKIKIDDIQIAKGRATSKKKAEEQASKRVYFTFQKQIENS